MKTKEKYRRMKRAVVYVNGGAVEGVSEVPPGFEIEVRDYDVPVAKEGLCLKRDEDGNLYDRLIYGGTMVRARSRRTARQRRIRAAAPALLRACKKLHDALSEFLEFPDERDVDRKAALRAIDASFAAQRKAEPEAFGNGKQSSTTKGGAR
jgi:hypothetical protein